MLADLQIYALFVVIAVIAYWLIPAAAPKLRCLWLIAISVLIIFYASIWALATCLTIVTIVVVCRQIFKNDFIDSFWAAWVGTLAVAAVLVTAELAKSSVLVFVGISYVGLKAISAIWDLRRIYIEEKRAISIDGLILLLIFFPIYSAGPIERVSTFQTSAFTKNFDIESFVEGLFRIVVGTFKVAYLANGLISPILKSSFLGIDQAETQFSWGAGYIYIWLGFIALYVNFSGYTDIAIGVARLFNISVRENFNFPLLATSLQNFWQRWHLSLGSFTNTFVFWPFARATEGRVEVSLIAAFMLIGLWHNLSFNYLFWGAMHGFGLAIQLRWQQKCRKSIYLTNIANSMSFSLGSRIFVLTYVSWLSAFANAKDLTTAVAITRRLFIG